MSLPASSGVSILRVLSIFRRKPDCVVSVDMKKVHDQALAKQTDFEKQLSTVLNPAQQQIVNNLRANADTYAALQRIGLLETPEFMKAMSN